MAREEDITKDDWIFKKTPRPHNLPIEQKQGSKNNRNSHIEFQKNHLLNLEEKIYVIQQLQQ